MTDSPELGLLAKLIIAAAVVMILAGIILHGISIGVFERIWLDLTDRPTGPMKFRFILQPMMAAIAAVRDGRADARAGRSPYFMTVLRSPEQRAANLREALNATARIVLLGIVMDVIYQIIVFQRFYPTEAVIIALLLAFVPYVILRGVVLRVARRRLHGAAG